MMAPVMSNYDTKFACFSKSVRTNLCYFLNSDVILEWEKICKFTSLLAGDP